MILFHRFQLKQIHSTQNKHSSVSFIHYSFTLFHSFIHFKLLWITNWSNISNCLLGEGKTCFHLTNNNVLLFFSKDTGYEYRIVDNCFFYFVWHLYELYTTSALPSEVLIGTIIEFMVKSFILTSNLFQVNFFIPDSQSTCQSYLVSYNENFRSTATTFLGTTFNVMYISAKRLVNLVLHTAFIQLFRMQVHTPYIQARCDTLFQIRFCNFSSVLPHSQTTCSLVPK